MYRISVGGRTSVHLYREIFECIQIQIDINLLSELFSILILAMTLSNLNASSSHIRPRDVQVTQIGTNTTVLRSRIWDRLRFEMEYSRQRGTTVNSYLIQADKIALLDPPGKSFTNIYLQELQQTVDLAKLDYVILSHVNPNRIVTLQALLEQTPQITVVCSRPGAIFLRNHFKDAIKTTNATWEKQIYPVRGKDTLNLGQGHELAFISAPTPRWPDGLCTYDANTRILYSDKFFGAHVCNDSIFDHNWKQLDDDRRYYYDCLHAAQAQQVGAALDKFALIPAKYYAPAHGPVVRHSLSRLSYDYRQWRQQQCTKELTVVLLYASAYGNTATLSQAIAQGLLQADISVELINCEFAESAEILNAIQKCDGFIIGSPTFGGHAPSPIQIALDIILSTAAKTKLAGVFGSYGWSGEAIDLIESQLQNAGYRFGFDPIRIKFNPTDQALKQAEVAASQYAQVLKKTKKIHAPRQPVIQAQTNRTEQAIQRLIGSLCVITDESHRAIMTTWVSQATFSPPGLIVAIPKAQDSSLITQIGDRFILNILQEGQNLKRYFLNLDAHQKNPTCAIDFTLADITNRSASKQCLILNDALAYLECEVQQRMECGDHWLVYAVATSGEVLNHEGVTAVASVRSTVNHREL